MGGWFGFSEQLKKDYILLYNQTIGPMAAAEDPTRPYVPSSPSNGLKSLQNSGLDPDPNSDFWGDKHYYNYNANGWRPENFPLPRCVTEFGFQSLPSLECLATAMPPKELNYFSQQMMKR